MGAGRRGKGEGERESPFGERGVGEVERPRVEGEGEGERTGPRESAVSEDERAGRELGSSEGARLNVKEPASETIVILGEGGRGLGEGGRGLGEGERAVERCLGSGEGVLGGNDIERCKSAGELITIAGSVGEEACRGRWLMRMDGEVVVVVMVVFEAGFEVEGGLEGVGCFCSGGGTIRGTWMG